MRAANKLGEGALFLALTGDEDVPGWGLSTLAHWTLGQKQNGRAMFYDYQLKFSDDTVRSYVSGRSRKELNGETGVTDYPVTAWGNALDEDDGRGLLLVVSRGLRFVRPPLAAVASAPDAVRSADPRHPHPHAPRRLRRPGREGGTDHRY